MVESEGGSRAGKGVRVIDEPLEEHFQFLHHNEVQFRLRAVVVHIPGLQFQPVRPGRDVTHRVDDPAPLVRVQVALVEFIQHRPIPSVQGQLEVVADAVADRIQTLAILEECQQHGFGIRGAPIDERDEDGDGSVECLDDGTPWAGSEPILGYADCDDTSSYYNENDVDGDGFSTCNDDCDDNDASSTIKADDADCDGYITTEDCDDTNPDTFDANYDGDGDGYSICNNDCDDTNPIIFLGSIEEPGNGVDEDCVPESGD